MTIRRALLSVSDKTGLVPFAQFLASQGIELLSTGGTAQLLREHAIPVQEVSDVTQFPEMMDGRVKTLHPAVHGGLLARRDRASHMNAAQQQGIGMIDLLVVNLYPFEATLNAVGDYETLIENIDIGGPAMIRSAAKNHASVTVIVDPADYGAVMQDMCTHANATTLATRQRLAATAFARTASYDTLIASWLTNPSPRRGEDGRGADLVRGLEGEASACGSPPPNLPPMGGGSFPAYLLDAALATTLRYGENPHQAAALYRRLDAQGGLASARQLQGKELSYNNLSDADAAWAIASALSEPAAVLIKHANPCGVAIGTTLVDAFTAALASDPVSAFGGILATNRPVAPELVEAIGSLFLEVIIAPEVTPEAQRALAAKKNLRVLVATPETHASPLANWMIQAISGGYLVQTKDAPSLLAGEVETGDIPCFKGEGAMRNARACGTPPLLTSPARGEGFSAEQWRTVTGDALSDTLLRDATLAWQVCKHVKSNAIVLVKNGATIGVGAGQMSRVDSVRIAIEKAKQHGHDPRGSVLASDAFFPFADNVELAAEAGINTIIQPGGSVRDAEVIAAAENHGITMLFTGMRHFKH